MDTAYISALSALAGSAIGGFTSLVTSWLVQQKQAGALRRSQELSKREALYGSFIDEASRRFGEAIEKEHGEMSDMISLYSMISRMRLFARPDIVEEARRVTMLLGSVYQAPVQTFDQRLSEHQGDFDPLRIFSEKCRNEMETI